ncbi:MAG: YkgJ family cysteine cluster protein [Candidatus Nanoarchaeia archaeon]
MTKPDKDKLSNLSRFKQENPCGNCFNCCKGVLVKVRDEDIERWNSEKRQDIIENIETWRIGSKFLKSKKDSNECIFLTPEGCSIHATRPMTCKRFPLSKEHAEEFNCKLIDQVKESNPAHKTRKNYYDPTKK